MFPYINWLHDILKDQDSFPLIRMPLLRAQACASAAVARVNGRSVIHVRVRVRPAVRPLGRRRLPHLQNRHAYRVPVLAIGHT